VVVFVVVLAVCCVLCVVLFLSYVCVCDLFLFLQVLLGVLRIVERFPAEDVTLGVLDAALETVSHIVLDNTTNQVYIYIYISLYSSLSHTHSLTLALSFSLFIYRVTPYRVLDAALETVSHIVLDNTTNQVGVYISISISIYI